MIDAKTAVNAASSYLVDMLPVERKTLRLEEIEIDESENFWWITLSYDSEAVTFTSLLGPAPERQFKVFKINAANATVLAMKIRNMRTDVKS